MGDAGDAGVGANGFGNGDFGGGFDADDEREGDGHGHGGAPRPVAVGSFEFHSSGPAELVLESLGGAAAAGPPSDQAATSSALGRGRRRVRGAREPRGRGRCRDGGFGGFGGFEDPGSGGFADPGSGDDSIGGDGDAIWATDRLAELGLALKLHDVELWQMFDLNADEADTRGFVETVLPAGDARRTRHRPLPAWDADMEYVPRGRPGPRGRGDGSAMDLSGEPGDSSGSKASPGAALQVATLDGGSGGEGDFGEDLGFADRGGGYGRGGSGRGDGRGPGGLSGGFGGGSGGGTPGLVGGEAPRAAGHPPESSPGADLSRGSARRRRRDGPLRRLERVRDLRAAPAASAAAARASRARGHVGVLPHAVAAKAGRGPRRRGPPWLPPMVRRWVPTWAASAMDPAAALGIARALVLSMRPWMMLSMAPWLHGRLARRLRRCDNYVESDGDGSSGEEFFVDKRTRGDDDGSESEDEASGILADRGGRGVSGFGRALRHSELGAKQANDAKVFVHVDKNPLRREDLLDDLFRSSYLDSRVLNEFCRAANAPMSNIPKVAVKALVKHFDDNPGSVIVSTLNVETKLKHYAMEMKERAADREKAEKAEAEEKAAREQERDVRHRSEVDIVACARAGVPFKSIAAELGTGAEALTPGDVADIVRRLAPEFDGVKGSLGVFGSARALEPTDQEMSLNSEDLAHAELAQAPQAAGCGVKATPGSAAITEAQRMVSTYDAVRLLVSEFP
ncbi:hypothetical protein JL722_12144 [Aureococcus anophagefferens]|nr:hypothetical protein JL722_12144 [Aureococcus anophagefferens]